MVRDSTGEQSGRQAVDAVPTRGVERGDLVEQHIGAEDLVALTERGQHGEVLTRLIAQAHELRAGGVHLDLPDLECVRGVAQGVAVAPVDDAIGDEAHEHDQKPTGGGDVLPVKGRGAVCRAPSGPF
jgi:hypothetical protein